MVQAVYAFISRRFCKPTQLWGLVRRELRWMMGSLPLLRCGLTFSWSGEVYAVDAFEWGGGACHAEVGADLVAECGRYNKRWRCKHHEASRVSECSLESRLSTLCLQRKVVRQQQRFCKASHGENQSMRQRTGLDSPMHSTQTVTSF